MGFDTDLALFSRRPQVDFEALVARPVRLYLDDFSNLRIPHFEDFIAVTRGREIWRTILCQTISQLEAVYGEASANTIVGTAQPSSSRASRTREPRATSRSAPTGP